MYEIGTALFATSTVALAIWLALAQRGRRLAERDAAAKTMQLTGLRSAYQTLESIHNELSDGFDAYRRKVGLRAATAAKDVEELERDMDELLPYASASTKRARIGRLLGKIAEVSAAASGKQTDTSDSP